MRDLEKHTEADCFAAANYPEVSCEMKRVAYHVSRVPGVLKGEILISFLKNHSIKVDWLIDNDRLVQLITSGALKTHHTERLFDSKRSQKFFLTGLEGYIAAELENCSSDAMHGNVVRQVSPSGILEGEKFYAHLPT